MAFITHDKTFRNTSQGCIYAGRSNSLVRQEIFCGVCKSNIVGLCYYSFTSRISALLCIRSKK